MENDIEPDDYELCMIIENGPLVSKKAIEDRKIVLRSQKNLMLMISELWRRMQRPKSFCNLALALVSTFASLSVSQPNRFVAHEGTNQVKQSCIELLMRKYEVFECVINKR